MTASASGLRIRGARKRIEEITGKYDRYWSVAALTWEKRDWAYNECLANDADFSKPDSEKFFILWEAKGKSIEINALDGVQRDHPWLWNLFVISPGGSGPAHVRFPWNAGDSEIGSSISPGSSAEVTNEGQVGAIRRFSTASRSCLALVPQDAPRSFTPNEVRWMAQHSSGESARIATNTEENTAEEKTWHRFHETLPTSPDVHDNLAAFASTAGAEYLCEGGPSRLYSIKTGVSYVGSTYEKPAHKNHLESNSSLAITRSNVVVKCDAATPADPTCRIQTELLTITAMDEDEDGKYRDGFQVRDVSQIQAEEDLLPAHAIPYTENAFSDPSDVGADVRFWTKNFARPLGRAKARLFLKYGMVHASANAQNFLMAFERGTPNLKAFVLRDVGDTFWHDDYIRAVLEGTALGAAHTDGLEVEHASRKANKPHQLLRDYPKDSDYPSPFLVRLCAFSTMTHGFGDKLISERGWTVTDVLHLTQAILDGYQAYISEAIPNLAITWSRNPKILEGMSPGDVATAVEATGTVFKYPAKKPYGDAYVRELKPLRTTQVDPQLRRLPAIGPHSAIGLASVPMKDLLAFKFEIRAQSDGYAQAGGMDAVEWAVNAEEAALCTFLERWLAEYPEFVRQRLNSLPPVLK